MRIASLNTNSGDDIIREGSGHGLLKRFVLPTMLVASCTLLAGATELESGPNMESDSGEVHPVTAVQAMSKTACQKERDFAMAEVHRLLDPNPQTEVVDLTIDPDYKGAAGEYLVNVVLDAHGLKLSVGVIVSVQHSAESYQATLNFID
jgi:hypothetical protein